MTCDTNIFWVYDILLNLFLCTCGFFFNLKAHKDISEEKVVWVIPVALVFVSIAWCPKVFKYVMEPGQFEIKILIVRHINTTYFI